MTKMEEHAIGVIKDVVSFTCGYSLALNLFALDSHILTGLFALGGIVLGRLSLSKQFSGEPDIRL